MDTLWSDGVCSGCSISVRGRSSGNILVRFYTAKSTLLRKVGYLEFLMLMNVQGPKFLANDDIKKAWSNFSLSLDSSNELHKASRGGYSHDAARAVLYHSI